MLGIGWGEILIIGLVALVVVGPDKLPELAKNIGRFYAQVRKMTEEAKRGLSDELELIKPSELEESPPEPGRTGFSPSPRAEGAPNLEPDAALAAEALEADKIQDHGPGALKAGPDPVKEKDDGREQPEKA